MTAVPKVLKRRGRALWRELVKKYEFDEHETPVLLEACRSLDRIDALEDVIEADGLMITGSTGQQVLHPAVAELRQQQATVARLLTQLNLEAAEGAVAMSRQISTAAQAAAKARWERSKAVRGA
ncbi:P27 family phage terminase small subunit [Microbacterium album]|uniref:Terminase n=1 Tax=Microbacterium album TaxID=2053191 RepID=A0A917IGP7_9MICO|nr:P27 family phage terminase small subunit [Microbacterium album]GGH44955.1 hypothetical protein GCM10010921_20010 [Microbacterium album]